MCSKWTEWKMGMDSVRWKKWKVGVNRRTRMGPLEVRLKNQRYQ